MAHLLLIDVPGGNDFTVLHDAIDAGHEVSFCTSDLGHYRRQGEITASSLTLARNIVEIRPFQYRDFDRSIVELHRQQPIDAILCLIDIRLIDASRIAAKLGLRFLTPETAELTRDKFRVREMLSARGIRQPRFAVAETPNQLRRALAEVGYPALVKPSDGYGSQNVSLLRSDDDVAAYESAFVKLQETPTDYGLGVSAGARFCVEQYIAGRLIGCDVFSDTEARVLLGINDKIMFSPPSFAMRGSCFPSDRYKTAEVRDYAFAILDAINFDFGAAHIEMMVSDDVPYLVEVNPRLVSAQIPYQMGYAFERSIYLDLINLHLGKPVVDISDIPPRWFSAIRWITAHQAGVLDKVRLPANADRLVRRVALFKESGDPVRPPISNGDRIGYVIAVGKSPDAAERLADDYVRSTTVELR